MASIVKRTTLIVRDLAASRQWYERVLGMSVWMDTDFTLSGQGLAAGNAGDKTQLTIMQADDPKIGMIGLLQHFLSISLFDPDGYFFECNQVLKITDAQGPR